MNALNVTRNVVRSVTIGIMIVVVSVSTADGIAQSYSALYEWALQHRLSGWKAQSFPLMVDLFIIVGELGLFLLAIDGFRLRKSFVAWIDVIVPATVAAVGWLVSLWFNVNHIVGATGEDKMTAGVPPVTAMVGLFILLRTVHRYMATLDDRDRSQELMPEFVPVPELDEVRDAEIVFDESARAALDAAETAGVVPVLSRGRLSWVKAETPDEAPREAVSPNGRTTYGKGPDHPKWDEGVALYRASVESPGKALSQRELAAELGMRNRSLAANIMRYVKEENDHDRDNGLPEATESATSQEGGA